MIKITKNILDYIGASNLKSSLLFLVILEHLAAAFCLNMSAYFKKVNYFHYDLIGQFISFYYWGCLLGALIGGMLTLHFKPTKISSLGLILLGGSFYCLFSSLNPWLVSTSIFFLGSIGTIISTSNITSLVRAVKENEGRKLSVISLELILFNLSFSFVSFILLDFNPAYISKFIQCLTYMFIFVGAWSFIFCCNTTFKPHKFKKYDSKLFLPKRKKVFMILISMIFCFGLIFSMVKVVFTPTLIERFGNNMISVIAASINPWLIVFIQPLIIERIKISGSIWWLGYGGLIVGLSYFMFGMITSFKLTAIVLILLTIGEMMFSSLSKHLTIQLYDDGREGVASGVWRVIFLGSGIIGPTLSGYIAEYYGVYLVWECCALLGLICFILATLLHKIKKTHKMIILNT